MSVARRADGRWIVRYKDREGAWRQKAFRDEQTARAFEASWIESISMSAMEERLTLANWRFFISGAMRRYIQEQKGRLSICSRAGKGRSPC